MEQKKTIDIRKSACLIVYKINYKESYSDVLLDNLRKEINDERDFNLLRNIVLGTLERQYEIDYYIKKISSIKFRNIEKKIICLLRISIYQLIYMDSIPNYAVLDNAVKISKKLTSRNVSKFVNAVLRNFIREKDNLFKDIKKENNDELKYNINKEIIDYLYQSYDIKTCQELFESLYNKLDMSIRVNLNKINREEVLNTLKDKGFESYPSNIVPSNILVKNPKSLHDLDLYKNAYISIQGEGSSLAVKVLNPCKDSKVLDICAAPGSKSLQIAEKIGKGGFIVANDIDENKLFKITENFSRAKFQSFQLTSFDASIFNSQWEDAFDYILADLPCSALGLMARKPEIRLKRNLSMIKDLYKLQQQIMDNVVKYLRVGGRLVFSTCTYGKYENYKMVDYIKELGLEEENVVGDKKAVQLFTHVDNCDGFFVSKFKKIR